MQDVLSQIGKSANRIRPYHLWFMLGFVVLPARLIAQDDSTSVGPPPHFAAAWAPAGKLIDVSHMGVLRQRVSVDLTNVSVTAALIDIRNRSGIDLVYDDRIVPADRVVTLHAKDITLASALAEVLIDTGLDVMMTRSGSLALTPCPHLPKPLAQERGVVAGRVINRETGAPLAGATVAVEGTPLIAVTNTTGRYRLVGIEPGTRVLTVRYIGYAPMTARAAIGANTVTQDFALQPAIQQLEQVVVTGTLVPTEIKAIPTPITVITAEEIQRQNVLRVDQLFRGQVSGAIAWDYAAFDYLSTINVRGGNSFNNKPVKVFIDGVEIAVPEFIATIDPNSVDHIELTRGPQASTMYGSDATGGVLQIFMKKGRFGLSKPEGEIRSSMGIIQNSETSGSSLRFNGGATLRGGGEHTSYNLAGYYRHDGEWTPSYQNMNWSFTAGAEDIHGPLTARVSARYARKVFDRPWYTALRDSGYVAFSKPPYETFENGAQTFGVGLVYRPKAWWRHDLVLGYDRFSFDQVQTQPRFTTPDDSLLQITSTAGDKASVFYSTTVDTKPGRSLGLVLTGGFNSYLSNTSQFFVAGTPSITGPLNGTPSPPRRLPYTNSGVFLQAQVSLADAFFLTAGGRIEWNTNFGKDIGSSLSPRIGLAHVRQFGATAVKFRLSYGESIRPPDAAQSDAIRGAAVEQLENRTLAPERQHGWDGGVELYWGSQFSFGVTYYRQNAIDLIDEIVVSGAPILQTQNRNVGEIRNEGWEVETRANFRKFQASAAFSAIHSTVQGLAPTYQGDYQVGDRVLGIPNISAGAVLNYPLARGTTIRGSVTYVGDWIENNFIALYGFILGGDPYRGSGRAYWMTYPSFTKLSFGVEQQISNGVSATFNVENVTDNRAFESENLLAAAPRAITLILHASY